MTIDFHPITMGILFLLVSVIARDENYANWARGMGYLFVVGGFIFDVVMKTWH